MNSPQTSFIPVGGVGEFGANAAIVKTETTTILIDCGLMFPPDSRKPGVDYYVVDGKQLLAAFPDLSAIFLTHGHEDHIGGLPQVLPQCDVPVHALPYTAKLVSDKFRDRFQPNLIEVGLNQAIVWGDIKVTFIGVTHSIQHACALVIETPAGTLLHSGDFKVDATPEDNHPFQSDQLAAWGERGIDVLLMDSTNATKPGFCPSDADLVPTWEQIIATAKGRVFLTTFSSHMPRFKRLIEIAKRQNRVIACLGRSLHRHLRFALETGYIQDPGDQLVSMEQAALLPDEQVLYVMTGSQGEPRSATARILRKNYRGLTFKSTDTVIFASKAIPGNERQLALLGSAMERMGVKVITARDRQVHASGHAYREELAYLLALTKPRTVAPIHGEFHHLWKHHQWLNQLLTPDQNLLLIEDGDCLVFGPHGTQLEGSMPIDLLPIDGNQDLPLPGSVLRDRKDMMYSGLLIISWLQGPDAATPLVRMDTRGMVLADPAQFSADILGVVNALERDEAMDNQSWAETLKRTVTSKLRSIFYGRPIVKCIVNGEIF